MAFEELDLTGIKSDPKEDQDEVGQKIETYYKQDMSDKMLRAYSWDEAIRYYDGDHHIEYNVLLLINIFLYPVDKTVLGPGK